LLARVNRFTPQKIISKSFFSKNVKEKMEIKLPSRLETIDEAVATATKMATESGLPDEALYGIDLAVREAVANAVKHGNKFDQTKQVKITFENRAQELLITVEDEGTGFELNTVPDPTNSENLLKESGRGILFMRSFMDEVVWEHAPAGGTIVRLTKKF
jgi:serine/threonine-protein kinase RsbW